MNVMIYGSKNITFLSDIVKNQIDSYIKSGATFFVGDANGTDCAIQRWLIYHSDKLSMTERHAEWLKLMDLMPDCEVPKRRGCRYWSSLFELIREYIKDNKLYGK